jgi:hypothetical protein
MWVAAAGIRGVATDNQWSFSAMSRTKYDGPNQMGGEVGVALLRGVPFRPGISWNSDTPHLEDPEYGRHTRVADWLVTLLNIESP